jgi:hypothetical protein
MCIAFQGALATSTGARIKFCVLGRRKKIKLLHRMTEEKKSVFWGAVISVIVRI